MNAKTLEEFDSVLAIKTDPKKWPIGAKDSVEFLNQVISQKRQHFESENLLGVSREIREGVRQLLSDYESEVKHFLLGEFDQRKMTLLTYKILILADVGVSRTNNYIVDGAVSSTGSSGAERFKSNFKMYFNMYIDFLFDRDLPHAFFSRRNLSPLSLVYSMYLGLDIVGFSKNELTVAEGVSYTRGGFAALSVA